MPVFQTSVNKYVVRLFCLLMAFVLAAGAAGLDSRTASAADGPDLIVETISISPAEPIANNQVTITVKVKNQGTANANSSSVICYVDAAIINTQPVGQLEPGMMITATFTWTAQPGTHVIKATADSNGNVYETDETNNTTTFTLTPLAPDLAVVSITWSPQSPSQGDEVSFSVTIGNHGNGRSSLTTVEMLIDGVSKGIQDIPGLDPGTTVVKTYSWISQSGQHALEGRVDMDNRNIESDESNNVIQVTYSTEAPDLIIGSISHEPEVISLNDSVTIRVLVTNQGSGRANPCHLGYRINEELKPLVSVPSIAAGESYNATFGWMASAGMNELTAIVDYYDTLDETSETNNDFDFLLVVQKPDLIISNISWDPEAPAVGEMTTVSITLKNQGIGTAGSSRVSYSVGRFINDYQNAPSLLAGEEYTFVFGWEATSGSERINATADSGFQVKETHEDNNSLGLYIEALPPDLIVESISWIPENPAHGESVSFNVTLKNIGPGRAEINHVGYYIDGELLFNSLIIPLESGETVSKFFTWKSEQGYHSFKAMADFKKAVVEGNETNNEFQVAVVAHMPDLVIKSITWSPSDIPPGEECTFDLLIKNTGTLPAPLTRLAYYVDGTLAGYLDMPALAAAATTSEKLIWPATAGSHRIEFVIDSTNLVEEIDEENNITVVTLPLPDLVLNDVSWSTESIAIGDTVTFVLNIGNTGLSTTQAASFSCSVDDEIIQSLALPEITPGETVTLTCDWVATGGSHSFDFLADVGNTTIEADETNNTRTYLVDIMTPDLSISDISWRMEHPLINNDVEITAVLVNTGTDTTAASQITYTLDDNETVYADIPPIPAGSEYTWRITVALEPGPHIIRLVADEPEEIIEINETNNTKQLSFDMNAPDLVVRTVSWDPQDAKPGDVITITVLVENRGTATAVEPGLILYVDGAVVQSTNISAITIGSTITHEFEWTVQEGLHELNVMADYGGVIAETDETNNSGTRSITFEDTGDAVTTPATLPSVNSPVESGFLEDNWWMILLVAGIIGSAVFISLLRSFRKE